jgi:hypothetical protein
MARDPLWRCKECGREFANRNQSHACAAHDLDHHFDGKPPEIRALFDLIVRTVTAIGPVRILPEKTRIAFQVRMSFAQVTPRRQWIDGHVVLARRLEHPRFRLVQTFSPRNHLHAFRISSAAEIDDVFEGWLREAYAVGEQRHLDARRTSGSSIPARTPAAPTKAKKASASPKRSQRPKGSTFDDVRDAGLRLAGVTEGTMYGTPALKLHGKLLACIASHKSAELGSLVVRLDFQQRDELIAAEPEIYYLKDHYVGYACVLVRLSRIRRDALADLVLSAWRFVSAQKRPRSRRR